MNYRNFSFSSQSYLILMECRTEYPTASGKGWSRKGVKIERKVITAEQYTNYVTSIPFFNNWGDGASCRATCGYTAAGYIPTSITTTGPHKCKRHIHSFIFIYRPDLDVRAGYRERDVMDRATTWAPFDAPRDVAYTLYTAPDNDGHRDGAVFTDAGRWIG